MLTSIAGGAGIAWLLWKFVEPRYQATRKEGDKTARNRAKVLIILSVIGAYFVGAFITNRVLLWIG